MSNPSIPEPQNLQGVTLQRGASVSYTGPTPQDLDHIPTELKAHLQWVLWRGADRIDQQTGEITGLEKIPIDPHTLHHASTTDTETWGTFEYCVDALPVALEQWENEDPSIYRGGGIGYVLSSDDSYTGVDLDHCRDADTRAIAEWAQTWIDTLNSYTQVSVSGTGVHIIVEATLPRGRRQSGNFQMWDHSRFFAMTGRHIPGTPPTIEARQTELTALWFGLFGPKVGQAVLRLNSKGEIQDPTPWEITAIQAHTTGVLYAFFAESPAGWPLAQCEVAQPVLQGTNTATLEDDVILTKARQARNAAKFVTLWEGDITGYPSQSEADLALCCMLAFWTQDPAQIQRLFEQSFLCRAKWHDRADYRERTITAALTLQTQSWTPHHGGQLLVGNATQDTHQRQNGTPPHQRPLISITTEITEVVDKAESALLALPKAPVIFQRARRLCVIAHGIQPPKWLTRPQDAPVIVEATPAHIVELATQAARWEKFDKRSESWVSALPPSWLVGTLQGRVSSPFPVLEGIIGAPTLRPDGSLLDTPGYDQDTGLIYDSNNTRYPKLPDHPTLDDARSAIGRLQEPLIDFLFAQPKVHLSAALAAILSVVCRFTIQGTVPLFAVRATTRGSGKSLLVDVISLIGTGRPAPRWPQNNDDDEDRKRLLTVAMAGDATVHIDNVVNPLGSPALDLALTAPTYTDRILGKTAQVEAPLSMVWFASGNNMQFKADTARRVVPIDIDPQMERPEERDGFQHSPLIPWVRQERPTLVVAALTLLRAYYEAGCPSQGVRAFGSFEAWSDLVRQALIWAGEADPCEGRKDIEAESNPEFETLATLLTCWYACYPTMAVTLKRALQDIGQFEQPDPKAPPNQWNELRGALVACDRKYDGKAINTRVVGDFLKTWQGRVVEGKRFARNGEDHRAIQWCVQTV